MDLMLIGLSLGMGHALLAVGLVLIYKSNRILNYAHGELGAFAVAMLVTLVRVAHFNYWLGLITALAATAALGALIERTVIQRLFHSPRLIALLATIGVAQIVIVGRLLLPKPKVQGKSVFFGGAGSFPIPFDKPRIEFGRVVFGPEHLMVLIVGPLLALAVLVFLRRSVYGVAIRAAAENSPRARLVGIPVRRVSTVAWVIAALLAGVSAILLTPLIGFNPGEAVGLPLLFRGLAAATIANFESVGAAFGWGLALGLIDEVSLFYSGRSGLSDAIVLGVVLAALLLRRAQRRRTTADEESSWQVADPVRPLRAEISRHPRWRATVVGSLALGGLLLLGSPVVMRPSGTFLLASICAVSAVTLSLTLLTGWSGQLSLGHWAIAGLGAILGSRFIATYHVPFWAAFALAGVVGGVAALLIGLPALRLPGALLAVVTLGFAVMSESWFFTQSYIRGPGSLPRPEWMGTRAYFYVTVGFLAVAVAVVRTLQKSRIGRNLVAVRDNPAQAASFGIAITRTRLTGFVVSGVLAALGGFLWSAGVSSANSNSFPTVRSLALLSAAIIGGLGSVGGALLGTAYLLGIPFFAARISPYISLLSTGMGVLLLVLVFPGGLARLAYGVRDRVARLVTGIDPHPDVVPASADLSLQTAASTAAG